MDPLQASDVPIAEELLTVPPKFPQEPEVQGVNWLRSAGSLALYLILGFLLFQSWDILLLLTLIVVLHELGHFAAMKAFRYKDLGIFFIPLLGAYVSGSKREVSQRESAIILLAGPMPGIIIGVVIYLITFYHQPFFIGDLSSLSISGFFIFLNLINLFPVYPLDGGSCSTGSFSMKTAGSAAALYCFPSPSWYGLRYMDSASPFIPCSSFPP